MFSDELSHKCYSNLVSIEQKYVQNRLRSNVLNYSDITLMKKPRRCKLVWISCFTTTGIYKFVTQTFHEWSHTDYFTPEFNVWIRNRVMRV